MMGITALMLRARLAGFLVLLSVSGFFGNLLSNGLVPILGSVAAFFFCWGCLGLMFPNERAQDHAKNSMFRALVGLGLGLLALTITGIVQNAANGQ